MLRFFSGSRTFFQVAPKIGITTAGILQLPHVTLKHGAPNQVQEPLDFGETSCSLYYDWASADRQMVVENLPAVLRTPELSPRVTCSLSLLPVYYVYTSLVSHSVFSRISVLFQSS